MPTFTASAPAFTRSVAASPVTMLPAITCSSGHFFLMARTVSSTQPVWPWAVSTTTTSTPAACSAAARSMVSGEVPTLAPTRRRPDSSLLARGKSLAFWISFTVIMPVSSELPLITSTFSMRCLCSSARTSSLGAPSLTVTSCSCGVITGDTGASMRVSKRRSRWVTMPTGLFPCTTGTPEMPRLRVSFQHLADGHLWRYRDGLTDHAAFEFLHLGHFGGLRLDGHVLVEDAHAAFLRHGDGQARLGDRVHGGREDGQSQPDAARELRSKVYFAGVVRWTPPEPAGRRRKSGLLRGFA